jgi:uncharacterized protein YkwD
MRRVSLVLLAPVVALALASCTPPISGGTPAAAPGGSLLTRVNAERAAAGVPALSACPALDRAAGAHSSDQAAHQQMSHVGSDGSTYVDRATRAGYRGWNALGENVAVGYSTVGSVMDGWMHSPGHRANVLNRAYAHFGSGYALSSNGTAYWTEDFGRAGTC